MSERATKIIALENEIKYKLWTPKKRTNVVLPHYLASNKYNKLFELNYNYIDYIPPQFITSKMINTILEIPDMYSALYRTDLFYKFSDEEYIVVAKFNKMKISSYMGNESIYKYLKDTIYGHPLIYLIYQRNQKRTNLSGYKKEWYQYESGPHTHSEDREIWELRHELVELLDGFDMQELRCAYPEQKPQTVISHYDISDKLLSTIFSQDEE